MESNRVWHWTWRFFLVPVRNAGPKRNSLARLLRIPICCRRPATLHPPASPAPSTPDPPWPHSGLHLYRAADRLGRSDRGPGPGKGLRGQDRQIPLRGQLQGHHPGQPRRLCKDCLRGQVRRDSGRPHPGTAGHRTGSRSRGRAGAGGHGGGDDVHHPRPPDASRELARRLRRDRGQSHQRLSAEFLAQCLPGHEPPAGIALVPGTRISRSFAANSRHRSSVRT